MKDITQLLQFRQGWLLPVNFHLPFRLGLMAFYWILQLQLLASPDAAWIRKDTLWIRWQYIFMALQLPIFLPALVVILTGGHVYHHWTSFPPAAACLLSALTLLLYPRILYNTQKYSFIHASAKSKAVLDKDSILDLSRRLECHMREKKPFLDPNYTIGALAQATGVTLHKLSAYINKETGKHFSDYVNEWRIKYCLEMMRGNEIVNLNLNGIAKKCGFNNRNTFSAAFKKVTGKPPSAYLNPNS